MTSEERNAAFSAALREAEAAGGGLLGCDGPDGHRGASVRLWADVGGWSENAWEWRDGWFCRAGPDGVSLVYCPPRPPALWRPA